MKNWRFDGPKAVLDEMIARAHESDFAQRALVASEPHICELCGNEIPAWSTYHLTCVIEDGEPIFVASHIFCSKGN